MPKLKNVVIAGGTGFLGSCIVKHLIYTDIQVTVLTRKPLPDHDNISYEKWDGKNLGSWSLALENADAVINFNGKSVDCRYTKKNKELIYSTRLDATTAIGNAIQSCIHPPKVWINAASSTIYRHSLDKEMDEESGEIGTGFSVDVCQKWEQTFDSLITPDTRKVLLRTAIVLGKYGGALQPLKAITRMGFGGRQGPGNQYISWIHERDFIQIVGFMMTHPEASGVYNVTSPNPVTNMQFMATLRKALKVSIGLPMVKSLLEFGSAIVRTEPELVLKSRRVVPKRLLEAEYKFKYTDLDKAIEDLVKSDDKVWKRN